MKARGIAMVIGLAASLALAFDSAAQRPPASASAAASASASARPKVEIPPLVDTESLPRFDADPLPTEKSKPPTRDDWKAAPEVRLTRMSSSLGSCHTKRVREWLKIRCERRMAGARLLAGSLDGVSIWPDDPVSPDRPWESGNFVELILPVRVGDVRVFELFELEAGYEMDWPRPAMILEELWPEGAKTAEVALYTR
jgi:hypothetical protein